MGTMNPAALLLLLVAAAAAAGEPKPVRPFEASSWSTPAAPLDAAVQAAWRKAGIEGAAPCSDEVFLRRAFLDLIGTVPTAEEAARFLEDRRSDRRASLVDALLLREEFADYWAMRWCDALRVKAEFPVNLWPNAVQAYHRWIRESIRDGMPLDRFVRELLTASGSNFREPAVNFWRAVQSREPPALASAVALAFLGERFESWPEPRRAGFAALFSRVAWKPTREWKEEIVLLDPAPAGPLAALFPDGTPVTVEPDVDPRAVFADWLLAPRNPRLARALANRTWAWIFGRGVVEEPDGQRPDHPPSVPGLLEQLEKDLVRSKWDFRAFLRTIVLSRTWQQSPVPRAPAETAAQLFACYPVRRLDAEVLIDALCSVGGSGEKYSSIIPEPFTFIPETSRTIALADGSITSPFLETFGRPSRDTGLASERSNDSSDAQRLHMLNSTDVLRRLQRSPRLREVVSRAGGNRDSVIRGLWLLLLSRLPEPGEAAAAEAYVREGRPPQEAALDLAWALVNTREFQFRH